MRCNSVLGKRSTFERYNSLRLVREESPVVIRQDDFDERGRSEDKLTENKKQRLDLVSECGTHQSAEFCRLGLECKKIYYLSVCANFVCDIFSQTSFAMI